MADTRNRRQVVTIGRFKPYTHPEYGAGAIRDITYLDGTIERRFLHYDTAKEGEDAEAGYVIDDNRVDPQVRKEWDDNKPKETATAGQRPPIPPGGSSSTEGTPDGNGGWDNNRPRQVIKDKDGNVIWAEELTGADLTAWRNNQQAGQPQTGEVRKPVEGRPGWTSVTRATVQGGNKTETTVFVGPDGQEVPTLPEKPGDPKTTLVTINGQPGYRTVVTPQGAGKPDKVEHFDPSGKPLAALPAEAGTKKEPVPNRPGIVKVTKGEGANTEIYYEDSNGNRVPTPVEDKGNFAVEPPGAPPASTQYGRIMEGLPAYRDFLNQQVEAKNLTPEAADNLMQARLAQAKGMYEEQQGVVSTQTGIYGQDITQRNQTLGEVQSRRGDANTIHSTVMSQFMPLLQYMPAGGGQAFLDLLQHGMEAGQQNVERMGGLREVPEVRLGPAAADANRAPMPGRGSFMAPYAPPATPAAPAVAGGNAATQAMVADPNAAAAEAANQAAQAGSSAAAPPLSGPMQAPGAGPTIRVRDPWGNEFDLTQQQLDNRPGGSADLTVLGPGLQGQGQRFRMDPAQMAASAAWQSPQQPDPARYGHTQGNPMGPPQGSFMTPYQQPMLPPGAQMLINDPDIDNAIVARAYRDVYGTDLPGFGIAA